MKDAACKLLKDQMGELDNEYINLIYAEKNELCSRFNISDLFLDYYDYSDFFVPPLEGDEKAPFMLPFEDDEKVEEKGLITLPPNKLLTKLPVLLAQTNAVNNSFKLKVEIRQMVYLLYQHGQISKTLYSN